MAYDLQTIKELLLKRFSEEPLNESEQSLLNEWAIASPDNQALIDNLDNDTWLIENLVRQDKIDMERIWVPISVYADSGKNPKRPAMFPWKKLSAAAIFLIVLGLGISYFFKKKQGPSSPPVASVAKQLVAPTLLHSATLTLADNSIIPLVQRKSGFLTDQGNIRVTKQGERQIVYRSPDLTKNKKIQGSPARKSKQVRELYNSVSVSRGMQYQVRLQDGTMVWLNNESVLRYPVNFSGLVQREVELVKGEAYFEVAKQTDKSTGKKIPFFVHVNGTTVEVRGTHFNIAAYEDESTVRTTLLEGSVTVWKGTMTETLRPGQQAVTETGNDSIKVRDASDIADPSAWKDGYFNFRNTDIGTAVKNLSRWYNKKFVFDEEFDQKAMLGVGDLYRAKELKALLKILEEGARLHFIIVDEHTIRVTR